MAMASERERERGREEMETEKECGREIYTEKESRKKEGWR